MFRVIWQERSGEHGYWEKRSKIFKEYTQVLKFKRQLTKGIKPASHYRNIKVFTQELVWSELKG